MASSSFEGSFSVEEYEAQVIENAAAVPNADNLTTCSCRGHCLRDKGRNYCPCKSNNSFCSSACHGEDNRLALCMNSRRVQEDDSDETTVSTISIFIIKLRHARYLVMVTTIKVVITITQYGCRLRHTLHSFIQANSMVH